MSASTASSPTFLYPTKGEIFDAIKSIQASCEAGQFTLIAPNGLVWQNENPLIILAALSQIINGRQFTLDDVEPRTNP